MKFQTFLHNSIHEQLSLTRKIIFVIQDQQPLLFFAEFLKKLKKCGCGCVESLDIEREDQAFIISRIETIDFLSKKTFYWLGNLSKLSTKKRGRLFAYLKSYHGDNALGFSANNDEIKNFDKDWLNVYLPSVVDRSGYELLAQFFYPQKKSLCMRLSRKFPSYCRIPLDKACLLLRYSLVLGNNLQQFCDEWLSMFVELEGSLFKLAEYLLNKRSDDFFKLWFKLKDNYPEVFWISYWSDLLWRAYFYTIAMKRGDHAEAQRIRFRLPFSFINDGWRKINIQALKDAHSFIYQLDYDFKNGAGTCGLELFYNKFFIQ